MSRIPSRWRGRLQTDGQVWLEPEEYADAYGTEQGTRRHHERLGRPILTSCQELPTSDWLFAERGTKRPPLTVVSDMRPTPRMDASTESGKRREPERSPCADTRPCSKQVGSSIRSRRIVGTFLRVPRARCSNAFCSRSRTPFPLKSPCEQARQGAASASVRKPPRAFSHSRDMDSDNELLTTAAIQTHAQEGSVDILSSPSAMALRPKLTRRKTPSERTRQPRRTSTPPATNGKGTRRSRTR